MRNIKQLIFGLTIFIYSCAQSLQDPSKTNDSLSNKKSSQPLKQETSINNREVTKYRYSNNWIDSLVKDYILNTKSELVKLAIKNKITEEWLFDQMINKDTTKYYSFQIGHDVTDEAGTNPRFVTDQWICIDSLRQQLYEYDIANDSLIRWAK